MQVPHQLQQQVLDHIRTHAIIREGDHVLVAVSGGPDSLALFHVLHALSSLLNIGQLSMIHLDHQLRGDASAKDARYVQDLAAQFGVPIITRSQDVPSYRREHRVSLEMAARACRRRFFFDVLRELGAQKVAVGHTATDQAEELLLRLFRGTGPSGLTGMKVSTPAGIIRPLLCVSREQILEYLSDQNLTFCVDSSNLELSCQRNILRHQLFPLLREHFHPRVVQTLCRCAELARDEESCWDAQIQGHWSSVCLEEKEDRLCLAASRLTELPAALQRRLLRFALERFCGHLQRIYAVHVEALRKLIFAGSSRKELHLPNRLRVIRSGEALVIGRRVPATLPLVERTVESPGTHVFADLWLHLQQEERSAPGAVDFRALSTLPQRVWLDADRLQWPLIVRSWRPGDRFQPMGLEGSKKLQDFFTDAKIPREQRCRIPLLCDQEKICWVMGLRLDDRVKITAETRRVLIAEMRVGS
jgi:tRNA(Ile)-lysidine synthase